MDYSKAEGFKGERAIITPYVIRNRLQENPISKQLYVTHMGYYPNARYHYYEREHGTAEHILIYCGKGRGWITLNGEQFFLKEGEMFILPPYQRHAYGADSQNPWSIYWLHFKGDNASFFQSIIGKVIRIPDANNAQALNRIQLFDDMFRNLEMGYSHENMEYITFSLQYFLSSYKYIPQYEVSNIIEDDIILQCIHFMRESLERKVSLQDIADTVGYSVTHLNTLFVQETSFSPIEYYNQLKIQRVCYYLQFTDLKIKEIAYKLDYYDPFHLSKAFRKEMEISPREYRKKYKLNRS